MPVNIHIHNAVAALEDVPVFVEYIPSSLQAADPLSRGEEMNPLRNTETLRILELEEAMRRGRKLKRNRLESA